MTGHDGYGAGSSDRDPKAEADGPVVYRIRLQGHLDQRWADWFDVRAITLEEGGETLLTCLVEDQAALHGLLRKVRDLGLPLVSVIRVKPP